MDIDLYKEAIEHIHSTIKDITFESLFPKVKEEHMKDFKIYKRFYDIDGETCGGGSDKELYNINKINNFELGYEYALLKLIKYNTPCALFACPINEVLTENYVFSKANLIDVVVGFMIDDDLNNIIPAWNNTSVYPIIGHYTHSYIFPNVPSEAKWIVCAALNSFDRKVVSLYSQSKKSNELYEDTPKFK